MAARGLRLRRLVLCAVMTTVIFLLTFLIKIPAVLGYVHVGDAAVCLAAAILPTPYAAAAAALGAALSDLAGGFAPYIPATVLIKAAMTLLFCRKSERMLCRRNLLAALVAALITPVGYYLADAGWLALNNADAAGSVWLAALAPLPFNCIQGAVSCLLFLGAAFLLDRFDFKARVFHHIG